VTDILTLSEDSEEKLLFVMLMLTDSEESEDWLLREENELRELLVIDILTLSEDSEESEERLLFETEKLTSEI